MSLQPLYQGQLKTLPIAFLDIGSQKMACWICRFQDNAMRATGTAYTASTGIKNGRLIDMHVFTQQLAKLIEEAEKNAGERVKLVVLCISGSLVKQGRCTQKISIIGKSVTKIDLKRLEEQTASIFTAKDNLVLHALAKEHILDGEGTIDNPLDMAGEELCAHYNVLYTPRTEIQNLLLAIKTIHLDVLALIAAPYAEAQTFLSEDEKILGAILVNMGAAKTDIAGFKEGKLDFIDSIPLGGALVTRDIAYGLDINLTMAERVKVLQGSCVRGHTSLDMHTEKSDPLTHSHTAFSVANERLYDIIAPRLNELLKAVQERLIHTWHVPLHKQRFVLTGGVSHLLGIRDAASYAWERPVRLGRLNALAGTQIASGAEGAFTTLRGAVQIWQTNICQKITTAHFPHKYHTKFGKILSWFRKNL